MPTAEVFQLFVSLVVGVVGVAAIPWAFLVERRLTRLLTLAEMNHSDPMEVAILHSRVETLEAKLAKQP